MLTCCNRQEMLKRNKVHLYPMVQRGDQRQTGQYTLLYCIRQNPKIKSCMVYNGRSVLFLNWLQFDTSSMHDFCVYTLMHPQGIFARNDENVGTFCVKFVQFVARGADLLERQVLSHDCSEMPGRYISDSLTIHVL